MNPFYYGLVLMGSTIPYYPFQVNMIKFRSECFYLCIIPMVVTQNSTQLTKIKTDDVSVDIFYFFQSIIRAF